jgi:gas vesicle protein
MSNDNGGNFMNAFLLGAVFGFVAGVLTAPRSGHEMREEINERTRGLREQVEHLADRVRHQLHRDADESGEDEGSRGS